MTSSAIRHLLFLFVLPFLPIFGVSNITLGSSLSTIGDNSSWISPSGEFAFGFYQLDNTNIFLLAIWYANIPDRTIVWHANTNSPVQTGSKVELTTNGLTLNSPNDQIMWTTGQPNTTISYAAMLDTGNFVLSSGTTNSVYEWESFSNPTDTLLPSQNLSLGGRLYSRLTETNYSEGRFELHFTNGDLELIPVAWPTRRPYGPYYSSGTTSTNSSESGFQLVFSQSADIYIVKGNGVSVQLSWLNIVPNNANNYYRATLGFDGIFRQYSYPRTLLDNQTWSVVRYIPENICTDLISDIGSGACGLNSYCTLNVGTPSCKCPPGYSFVDPDNKFGGCKPNLPLGCGVDDGSRNLEDLYDLKIIQGVNWPLGDYESLQPYNQRQCERSCLIDCSCDVAIFDGNTTCWKKRLPLSNGKLEGGIAIIKVRKALGVPPSAAQKHWKKPIVVTSVVIMSILILSLVCWLIILRRRGLKTQVNDNEKIELPIFDMVTISRATNKFCDTNKIGEGGFGPVYKGLLSTGKEIAVKRLSTNSKQGLNEFKNEVILIAKLQHRNLVRLLGCCIHGEERMLIYEYMPNGSLDSLIFGLENTRSKSLTWKRRLDIIVGIAQGVLYLHRDSRLRVIHRDLKASNVLLDCEMNPKISDFGLARAFGGDQSSAITRRVVGTYGYMSPEYMIDGLFSMKSDVFSFGVIVLEILSGKRNRLFHHPNHDLNLLGHAWTLWIEGKALELLDPLVESSFPISEVLRCIQVGLLCVQKCPEDRPPMSDVLLMIITEAIVLPQPKQPGFYIDRNSRDANYLQAEDAPSNNEMSMTQLEAR